MDQKSSLVEQKCLAPKEHSNIRFTTLGVVVLDELRLPSQEPMVDVIGGSGAFSEYLQTLPN